MKLHKKSTQGQWIAFNIRLNYLIAINIQLIVRKNTLILHYIIILLNFIILVTLYNKICKR